MQLKLVHVLLTNPSNMDEFDISQTQKIVMVDRKTDTYESLKSLVLKEFFPSVSIDPSLFRLRAYNV
jgi:hypothetical protein